MILFVTILWTIVDDTEKWLRGRLLAPWRKRAEEKAREKGENLNVLTLLEQAKKSPEHAHK